MSVVAERLAAAGFTLPGTPTALGAYVPAVRAGSLVFTAGQLPLKDSRLLDAGKVGVGVTVEEASVCTQQAVLNALAAASTVCDLDEVANVVKLTGYVASEPSFTAQPSVVDAGSALLAVAFGEEAGRHARAAVGVSSLPLDAPVEVDLVLALR